MTNNLKPFMQRLTDLIGGITLALFFSAVMLLITCAGIQAHMARHRVSPGMLPPPPTTMAAPLFLSE